MSKKAEKNRIAEENLAQMEEAAQNEIEKIGEGHLSAANYVITISNMFTKVLHNTDFWCVY